MNIVSQDNRHLALNLVAVWLSSREDLPQLHTFYMDVPHHTKVRVRSLARLSRVCKSTEVPLGRFLEEACHVHRTALSLADYQKELHRRDVQHLSQHLSQVRLYTVYVKSWRRNNHALSFERDGLIGRGRRVECDEEYSDSEDYPGVS